MAQTRVRIQEQLEVGVQGDVIYYGAGLEQLHLAIGTTGQVLTVVGGLPVWADNTLPVGSADGDTIYWDNTLGEWVILPAGGAGEVLTIVGGIPSWEAPTSSSFSITDGTTTETVLSGNTVTFTGEQLISAVVSATDTVTVGLDTTGRAEGDIIYFDGTDWAILPVGADGEVLKLVTGSPSWEADTAGSFTAAGSTGTPQTISSGDTLNILGGAGLTTVASATDTITINSTLIREDFDIAGPGDVTLATAGANIDTGVPMLVYRNGVLQRVGGGNDYTVASNVITFNAALIAGEVVSVLLYTVN